SQVYAAIIYAVLSSARSTGHYGARMLANAPLLDAILAGAARAAPPRRWPAGGRPRPPPPAHPGRELWGSVSLRSKSAV
ncbi:hypothetical protein, partial [Nocardia cyriacigeorgica]|uniref:hypothetical protein n=1 Tax=Nocardia cyriacigeorgica TaxID=135487 RepID=UPI0024555EB7